MRQLDFMAQTITDFRNFFKPAKEKIPFLAGDAAREIMNLMGKLFSDHNIRVTIHGHSHFKILGYPNEFKQVILNIFNNAKDAMVERRTADGTIDVYLQARGEFAEIRIEDNAGGIPEELLPDQLFQSYVSTKGERGTGIGLSLARQIIEKMGGTVTAANTDRGACFTITLPLADETPA